MHLACQSSGAVVSRGWTGGCRGSPTPRRARGRPRWRT